MSQSTGAPSLFDDGQIGTGGNNNSQSQAKLQAINLIDLLHDGFYLVFDSKSVCAGRRSAVS